MKFFDVLGRIGGFALGLFVLSGLGGSFAFANGYGEDGSWQFQTPADQANLAAVQTMIQEKKAGMFSANRYVNNYNTTIEHETNCSVSSESVGNSGSNSMSGNSSSSQGTSSTAAGNSDSNAITGSGSTGTPGSLTSTATNSGQVGSSASGNSNATAGGTVNDALNSSQGNNGSQSSVVSGNTACQGMGGGSLN